MQNHQMRLRNEPFDSILKGEKVVEIRLLDEKRRAIDVGDEIIFSRMENPEDKIQTKVTGLKTAADFVELFSSVDPVLAGWPPGTSPESAAADMNKYYSMEDQALYGVVGIELEKYDRP